MIIDTINHIYKICSMILGLLLSAIFSNSSHAGMLQYRRYDSIEHVNKLCTLLFVL